MFYLKLSEMLLLKYSVDTMTKFYAFFNGCLSLINDYTFYCQSYLNYKYFNLCVIIKKID